MDNSHRRIIAELEEKHRQEAEQLRLEKEQALAEETQATLAGMIFSNFYRQTKRPLDEMLIVVLKCFSLGCNA